MGTCTKLDKNKYLNKSEREHLAYCESKNKSDHPFDICSAAEGCKLEHEYGSFIGAFAGGGKCTLNKGETLSSAYISGGFGFGKLCLNKEFTRTILLLIFPPSYVFIKEMEKGFTNKGAIIMSFIYTCIFYFPGLIYTLMYKHGDI